MFHDIANYAPSSIWTTDATGRCTYLNRRWYEFTGQTPETALGFGWLEATHPDDKEAAAKIFLNANAKREPFRIEYRLRRADGVYRWSLDAANPRFDSDGTFLGYVGTVIDIHDRREAEQSLRASEERLRLATEHAEIGFWDVDEINGILHWPPIVKGMFGIAEGQPISMVDFYAGLHPEDREATSAAYAAAADPSRRALYDVEYRTVGKEDGLIRWVAAKGKGVFDEDGRCIRVVGIAIDITARKGTELKLRELTSMLEQRVEERTAERDRAWKNSRDLQLVLTEDGKIAVANDAWLLILGYRPEEVAGRSYTDFVHEDDRAESAAAFEVALKGALPPHESRYRHRDGSWRCISWVAAPERGRVYASGRDVTEERERQVQLEAAEVARRDADTLYRAYFENSPEALFVIRVDCDDDFEVEQINPAHERAVGFKLSEVQGRRLEDFLPSAVAEPILRRYREVTATGAIVEYREVYNLNGVPQHWDTSLVPIRKADGRIGRIIGSSRNVTVQVVAEERLRQAQKMEAVGQLTGGMAHDFNNLLGAVVGGFDLIRRKPEDPVRVRSIAESGLAAAERGARLTAQLLAFSRAQKIDVRPVIAAAAVEGMRDLLSHTLGPQIRLSFDLDGGRSPVLSDPVQLEMAVLNLAINARDAMLDGGDLTIRTTAHSVSGNDELPDGTYVELSVTDTGTGMPPEVASKAFEPFFTTKGIGQGTGLGLSQVYGIAQQAGGIARILSQPGIGTTVSLWLPTTNAEAVPELGDRNVSEEATAEPVTVLIIDDDEDLRQMLCRALESLGYDVIEAPDGAAGLTEFGRCKPDLVLLDYAMPSMNGAEVAGHIREMGATTPIVFVSGYSDTAALARVSGPRIPLLRKPFRVDELQAVIQQALADRAEH